MNITAIHLVRLGSYVVVKAEIGGRWVTVIKEYDPEGDAPFSHIVEEGGMEKVNKAVREIESLIVT
jgi:hypothetical protein